MTAPDLAPTVATVALVIAAAAVALGVLSAVTTRSGATGLAVLLDLLLAAGLLRLAVADTWTAIGTAAAVVAVRKLAGVGIAAARRSTSTVANPRPGRAG